MPTSSTPRPIRRVLYILQSTAVGGMETFCVDQATELGRRGIDVMAIIPTAPQIDVLAERFRAGGARVVRLDPYRPGYGTGSRESRIGFARKLYARLIALLRGWQPDVVHLHRGNVIGGLGMLALARLFTNATVVFSDHDAPIPGLQWKHRLGTNVMDRVAHAAVAVSRFNAVRRIEKIGSVPDRFASILNGIPIQEASAETRAANRARVRESLGISPDTVVIGCVVRLVEGKGLGDLFNAFARIKPGRDCTLLMVGDGAMRAELEEMAARLGVADAVKFAGFQTDPVPFFDAMDAFVLAVPSGTMSIALLEAMARGLAPVITFGGPEEAVIHEETGLRAAPNDPENLGEALARLVDDTPLRTSLGEAAAAHVRRHFSIGRAMDDHLELYATAQSGHVPERLRADGPPNPRPGDR